MKTFYVLNGPNLNRLGKREPDIYGNETLENVEQRISQLASENEATVIFRQSNHEGDLIDWIHEAEHASGIILNPGAFTHYSYAIRDAIASVPVSVVEVHISNVHKREPFRHTSVISPVTTGQIVGFGLKGYELALQSFL
ncbi:type II 3-dehydroquinate dehydratase [Pseudalkalibacillus hwajinpoensis]|uniref:type II 3-dehydroquinate dehydratase n=1 Tax=Guptibacillus hwajinpoensis TaxID=208199 RepID=UPI001CD49717|nr:type II 3-dehydroquinate dehydratase [Pseudalkalibacillus hwajinpoensis]MCA0991007.1 type II 3-dehydroquinate dehydratase [Pseudalkalibacillus hwajinpoensis]